MSYSIYLHQRSTRRVCTWLSYAAGPLAGPILDPSDDESGPLGCVPHPLQVDQLLSRLDSKKAEWARLPISEKLALLKVAAFSVATPSAASA